MHGLHDNRVFLSARQVVKETGRAHLTAGGVVSTDGGRLDAVARGCGRGGVTPADQSCTCGAVKMSGHVGGRTRGWRRKRGTSETCK